MADISMCRNEHCPLKQSCYRYTAKANRLWQSYSDFKFTINDKNEPECEYYWNRT